MWQGSSWDPLTQLGQGDIAKHFCLIAMDQRMSHQGNLPDHHNVGWPTFRDDQLALLDHLGIDKCHAILGSCIGPAYALQLLRDAPTRFDRAVLLQPIGLSHHTTEPEPWEGTNAGCEKQHWFGDWATLAMERQGRASRAALDQLHANMFGPERYDFCFTVTRHEMASQIPHPLLVFCGRDLYHPAETAREIAHLSPHPETTLMEEWRDVGPEKWQAANVAIQQFLLNTSLKP
mmetsp:Transcript_41101/g.85584  ORF Transcript_41101/g.85584 Transcript_41101/m.85584 type:complete len:233 (-) Transcript_41101:1189-1887(-)